MKYITIPADVELGLGEDRKMVTQPFTLWLNNPLSGSQFLADGGVLRRAAKIEIKFEGKKAGDIVILDDADWELLHDASENPKGGFNHPAVKIFLPFMDAVAKAAEDDPREAVEEA